MTPPIDTTPAALIALAERLEGRARDFETLAADIPKRWTNQHLRDGVAYNLTVYAKVSRDDAVMVRALAAPQETPQGEHGDFEFDGEGECSHPPTRETP